MPMQKSVNTIRGFTVVEIVVTIVILSILAAFAMTRFFGANDFNAPVVRDQLIAMLRSAHQGALGRPDVSVTITPNASGSTLTIINSDDGGTIQSAAVGMDSVSISTDNNTTSPCGSPNGSNVVSSASPLVINFGELGDLVDSGPSGSESAVTSALRICLNNTPASSICVSPSGFAYSGNCDV